MKPGFNPPFYELADLTFEGNQRMNRKKQKGAGGQTNTQTHRKRGRDGEAWSRAWAPKKNYNGDGQKKTESEPMTFAKQSVQSVSTCSMLTAGIKDQEKKWREFIEKPKTPRVTLEMAKEYGVEVLSTSHLGNAFEDSSDEED